MTGESEDAQQGHWSGPDDPANPQNWPPWKKRLSVAVLSSICFVTPLGSSMIVPGVPELMDEFHSDNSLLSGFVVSIYVLGFAIGPSVLAPASERWGRALILNLCNFGFVLTTVACALSNSLAMLHIFRLLSGCFGAAPLAVGGGTIGDMMKPSQRGAAMAGFSIGPLFGPVIGPVIGGYLTEAKGWRWLFWTISIIGAVVTIVTLLFLRETYEPVLSKRILRKNGETRVPEFTVPIFASTFIRPMSLLFYNPVVFALALFLALIYGYLYLLFTTFPRVFEQQYHFGVGTAGLSYLGLGIGTLIGLAITGSISDRIMTSRVAQSRDKEFNPENRLIPMIYAAPIIPVGFLWYGWSSQEKVSWIVPMLGTVVIGAGLLSTTMPAQIYCIDAFTIHSASAIAAITFFRSLLGGLLPLVGSALYDRLGLGWGNTLLAGIALLMCPIPVLVWRYGENIRKRQRDTMDRLEAT